MQRPAWFVASLLAMLATLMLAHLAVLLVGTWECDRYADVLLERASQDPTYTITASNEECNAVEETFSDAVGQYLGVILSLLGGAALSGTVAIAATRKGDDDAGT
jgi:hypothetical protein